jgi:CRISPR-associated endonuclease Csn1
MFGMGRKSRDEQEFIRRVVERLARTDADDEIDNRSIESVGWMANELRHRLEQRYLQIGAETSVGVFRGWITAAARRASGIQGRILLIGGQPGKNRLDRRHHAVDAATIAMLRPGAAQALVVRDNLKRSQELGGVDDEDIPWKSFRGANSDLFDTWVKQMVAMAELLRQALEYDRIPVFEFIRLKLGSSRGHEDTIRGFRERGKDRGRPPVIRLRDELPMSLIDRSATPAQWVALTRADGFVPGSGLPADESRTIRIHGRRLAPDSELDFFPTAAGCIAVRGGYAELGAAFHHARIYRCTKRLKSGKESVFFAMMRVYQVDLLKHRHEDLFSVEIPPQAMSRRAAEARLRVALDERSAEYVGWIVPGDELLLNMASQTTGAIADLLAAYPGTTRWSVDGFYAIARLRLRPKLLSGEGLPPAASKELTDIIGGRGWLPSISVVFDDCSATVIRRDILGRPRLTSNAALPTCWPLTPFHSRGV